MSTQISLADFRKAAANCDCFTISRKDTFSPVDLTITFDRVFVNLSASPYACFASDSAQLVVKHIKSISRQYRGRANKVYVFSCCDYQDPKKEKTVKFKVECAETNQKGE